MNATDFAARIRTRQPTIGYWLDLGSPVVSERLAGAGYDYVCLDAQHGLFGYVDLLASLIAVDAAGAAVGLVRVEANLPTPIGRALDAGAAGVIVPLVDTAAEAAAAVAASRYPPKGVRSFGPTRSELRIGPTPAAANAQTVVLGMIETQNGLANVEQIAATPGLDGLYIGPSDLTLAVGGSAPGDPAVAEEFEAAVSRIRAACESAGIAAGIHTPSGAVAARRLTDGFTFVSVSSDLSHLVAAARDHLAIARAAVPQTPSPSTESPSTESPSTETPRS